MQGKIDVKFGSCAVLAEEIEKRAFKNGFETPGTVRGAGAGPALLLAGPDAGSRPCRRVGKAKPSATGRAFIRAVQLCPTLVVASLWRLQRLHVNARGCPCLKPSAGGSVFERRVHGAKARPRQGKPIPGCPSASALLPIISRFTLGYA